MDGRHETREDGMTTPSEDSGKAFSRPCDEGHGSPSVDRLDRLARAIEIFTEYTEEEGILPLEALLGMHPGVADLLAILFHEGQSPSESNHVDRGPDP